MKKKKKKLKKRLKRLAEHNAELKASLSLLRSGAVTALEEVKKAIRMAEFPTDRVGVWGTSGSVFWVDQGDARLGRILAWPGVVMVNGRVVAPASGSLGGRNRQLKLYSRKELAEEFGEAAVSNMTDEDRCQLPEALQGRALLPVVQFPLGTLERLELAREELLGSL